MAGLRVPLGHVMLACVGLLAGMLLLFPSRDPMPLSQSPHTGPHDRHIPPVVVT